METKIERLRKALTQAAMEVASDGSDNIKNYETAFQDAIENIYPDEPWWKILGYWDIFDAMFFGRKTTKEMINEIVNHVLPEYRDDEPKKESLVTEDTTAKETEIPHKEYTEVKDLIRINKELGQKAKDGKLIGLRQTKDYLQFSEPEINGIWTVYLNAKGAITKITLW